MREADASKHALISEAILMQKGLGICTLKITGDKLSNNECEVEPLRVELQRKIEEPGICYHQIYNADESGLYWRCLSEKTLMHAAEKGVPGREISKDRITFMPCSNASGDHKLWLLAI